jgi:hypothetical protein
VRYISKIHNGKILISIDLKISYRLISAYIIKMLAIFASLLLSFASCVAPELGSYTGSKFPAWLSVTLSEGLADINLTLGGASILSAQAVPFQTVQGVQGGPVVISLDEAKMVQALVLTNQRVKALASEIKPSGMSVIYNPNGKDGQSDPSIYVSVKDITGKKILGVNAEFQE